MNQKDFIRMVSVRPIFQGYDKTILNEAIAARIPSAINRIITRYPFDFITGDYTTTSVASQAEYELEGEYSDARDIISVKYDTQTAPLDNYSDIDMEAHVGWLDDSTPSSIYAWAKISRTGDYPRIKLLGTPAESGKTIYYKYARKNVSIDCFPSEWIYVLEDSLLACFGDFGIGKDGRIISLNSRQNFENSLLDMIENYQSKNQVNPVRIDEETINNNILINDLHGYTGNV